MVHQRNRSVRFSKGDYHAYFDSCFIPLPLLGLSASAFLFNTSEFMPIGLLLDISQSFGMSPGHTGIMITLYAWFVGFLSLPLMLATCRMAPKRLLLLPWPFLS